MMTDTQRQRLGHLRAEMDAWAKPLGDLNMLRHAVDELMAILLDQPGITSKPPSGGDRSQYEGMEIYIQPPCKPESRELVGLWPGRERPTERDVAEMAGIADSRMIDLKFIKPRIDPRNRSPRAPRKLVALAVAV